ncbi:hypothetical protein Acr_15g0002570 [Actinidia rufa]|uniref:RNA-binding (RRM/RBD/RNP motifs) family protein n=1 Tax=Actinidia rufa TaxID=165716 RepID=A0A7J0FUP6_9ERIC|nr:hypothetical protein Acr_15g0002570 [Actinidia rufa]
MAYRSRDPSVENPGNNLYVTGLPTRVTKRDLEKHFSTEGKEPFSSILVRPRQKQISVLLVGGDHTFLTTTAVDHILPVIAGKCPTHDLAPLMVVGHQFAGAIQSRYYSPDDYYYRRSRYRSVSRSISPRVRRSSRRSYSRSLSPRPRRGSRKSNSHSVSPRRSRRSYSRSMSPLYKRSARRSYSPSISPRPRRRSHGCRREYDRDSYSSRSRSRSCSRSADYRSVSGSVTPRSDSPSP